MNGKVCIIAAAALAVSCSLILEDRGKCPCILSFEVLDDRALPEGSEAFLEVFGSENTNEAEDYVPLEKLHPDKYSLSVARSARRAGGIIGFEGCYRDGTRFIIPEGFQCDRYYVFTSDVDASGEEALVPVTLRKEHCVLTVSFPSADPGAHPFGIVISAFGCGIDLSSGIPVGGRFRARADYMGENTFRCILPRLADPDILDLEIVDLELGDAPMDSFSLSAILSEVKDFSWADDNLKDITLSIDRSRSEISVSVEGWSEGSLIHQVI